MNKQTAPQSQNNIRALCANIAFQVIDQGQSLNQALLAFNQIANDKDRALIQEISFGVMRVLPELEFYLQKLMDKPLAGKTRIIHFLLLVGLYQILYTRIPAHATVSETVNGVLALKRPQFKALTNGVLRSFLRNQPQLTEQFQQTGNTSQHPIWLLNRIKQAYPEQWSAIIAANNQKPPMWLRVNKNHYTVEQYQAILLQQEIESTVFEDCPCALRLHSPVAVNKLPYFAQGAVTVQDLSAQYAAILLDPRNHESILDLCAAPGGKTTHILEIAPQAKVLAVDIDQQRIKRVEENLQRLQQHAEVKVGNGLTPHAWCNDQQFDRILLDAPCSATGIIRRHSDIKWLRRDKDILELADLQLNILEAIWPYLKPNGTLLYSTCSILPQENHKLISNFLAKHTDAKLVDEPWQILPSELLGDGFFYSKLIKS